MEDHSKTTEVLNDLIKINNDRIAGYEKAIAELPPNDSDLSTLFHDLANQSHTLKAELQQHVSTWENRVEEETTAAGKIYRGWMGVKQTFAVNDRKAILESCEYGEDAAQKAYREASEEEGVLPEAQALIMKQKAELLASHDRVKLLRDQERNRA